VVPVLFILGALVASPFMDKPADCRPVDPVTYEILSEQCPGKEERR
jgi:hypothetical protein